MSEPTIDDAGVPPTPDAATADTSTIETPLDEPVDDLQGSCGCSSVGKKSDGWLALLIALLYVQRKRVSHVA